MGKKHFLLQMVLVLKSGMSKTWFFFEIQGFKMAIHGLKFPTGQAKFQSVCGLQRSIDVDYLFNFSQKEHVENVSDDQYFQCLHSNRPNRVGKEDCYFMYILVHLCKLVYPLAKSMCFYIFIQTLILTNGGNNMFFLCHILFEL